ncbi:MAG: excinuclease ABC subunit UvrB [Patescibacteria group bacterium]|nr:excinuclease ABC subunit UvrB [Patescibacteria group bacterium]
MTKFQLNNIYPPRGDQPKAIDKLVAGYDKYSRQTLLGVTGSGKTFTVANVINEIQKPTLVLSHNKTLAAQLYQEFQTFFPNNKVCYFISYYDYYQPESYLPPSDTYIEKDVMINEQIEQLRMEAATALMSRQDVIVVSSVSCIYGFGQPSDFQSESFHLKVAQKIERQSLLKKLVAIQYERNDTELRPGRFRAKGDTIDVVQGFSNNSIIRIELHHDRVEKISELHPITKKVSAKLDEIWIYPARPFVVPADRIPKAINSIRQELAARLPELDTVESYRLKQRTNYDLEMMEQLGYCKGIENYSRHFDDRLPGQPPFTLLDFFCYSFANDWLMVVDESHQTIPQLGGMYHGDFARKKNLIDYGFRLPSAYDNRPLKFDEFEKYMNHVIYVSATPSDYEAKTSQQTIEQIIRPTGVVDPPIEIKPLSGQIDDVIKEVKQVTAKGYRTLITTLTKKMAEDLSYYLQSQGMKSVYLHSEIDTMERTKILRQLRIGKYDVLVGINLLREGLDLPEVALVAILDADKEGFLRNARSLIQTIGRAARNVNSKVIMYADVMTRSIKEAISETDRRRKIQQAYNAKHGITPTTIIKSIAEEEVVIEPGEKGQAFELDKLIIDLAGQMEVAAENLEFEKAIELRDRIELLKKKL